MHMCVCIVCCENDGEIYLIMTLEPVQIFFEGKEGAGSSERMEGSTS